MLNAKFVRLLLVLLGFLLVTSFIIFLQKYPVYHAQKNTPKGYVFSGQASWFDPWDINVYVSAIESGKKNGILLPNLYSTDNEKPAFIYPIYTVPGYLFREVNSFTLYHSLSIIMIVILCAGIFTFSYMLLRSAIYSLIAIPLVILGRGFGWINASLGSPDITITSFTFKSALQRPHEAIGTILYIAAMVLFFQYLTSKKRLYSYLSLLALFFLVFFYPYYILIFFVVFLVYIVRESKLLTKEQTVTFALQVGVICLVTIMYFFHLYSSGFSAAASENLKKISPFLLVMGYGFYLPIFLINIINIRRLKGALLFMVLWVSAGLAASYLPLGFSRFFLRGLFFPLGILTLFYVKSVARTPAQAGIFAFTLAAMLLTGVTTSIFVYSERVSEVKNNNIWYYLHSDYQKAFEFIRTAKKDNIMAHPYIANFIPAYTAKHVYAGHSLQTTLYKQKEKNMNLFYSQKPGPRESIAFLKDNSIAYVLYGPLEKKIGPLPPSYLIKIFQSGEVSVYEVPPPSR